MAQELVALPVGLAITVDVLGAEKRVRLSLPLDLQLSRRFHPAPDGRRRFPGHRSDELGFARRGHLELEVDAIGERSGDAAAVARDALGRAAAAAAAVAAVAAGAGVHGRDELEARGKERLARRARDRHPAGLQWLA